MNISAETKQRYEDWWKGKLDEPLVYLTGKTNNPESESFKKKYANIKPYDYHLSPDFRCDQIEEKIKYTTKYFGDAFPYVDLNLGPGSLCTYFGCNPQFSMRTIWYDAIEGKSLSDVADSKFIENGGWWEKHLDIIKRAVKRADGKYFIGVPDIQEGIDIVSAIRHPSELCLDLLDEPSEIVRLKNKIDKAFYYCFDEMYNLVKDPADGFNCFTAFSIIGKGKTTKIQCDFSALISPAMFDEFALPELNNQCDKFENTLYHLDGKDAIRHLDSILSMKNLNALQWVPGAGQKDPASDEWLFIYDKTYEAGKSLWISIYDGDVDRWIERAQMLIKRYGKERLFLIFGETDEASAKKIMHSLKRDDKAINFEV